MVRRHDFNLMTYKRAKCNLMLQYSTISYWVLHTAWCFPSNSTTVIPIGMNFCHMQDRPLNFVIYKSWNSLMHRAWRDLCMKSKGQFTGCCTLLSRILSHSDQRHLPRHCWLPSFHSCLTMILDVHEYNTPNIFTKSFTSLSNHNLFMIFTVHGAGNVTQLSRFSQVFPNHLTVFSSELTFPIKTIPNCTFRYLLSSEQMLVTRVLLWTQATHLCQFGQPKNASDMTRISIFSFTFAVLQKKITLADREWKGEYLR